MRGVPASAAGSGKPIQNSYENLNVQRRRNLRGGEHKRFAAAEFWGGDDGIIWDLRFGIYDLFHQRHQIPLAINQFEIIVGINAVIDTAKRNVGGVFSEIYGLCVFIVIAYGVGAVVG